MPTRPPFDSPRPPANADLPSLLEELAASGLSATAFARERGIPVWKLYRAKRAAGGASRPRSRGLNSRLIPVHLVDAPAAAPPLELQLRSGLRLSIPTDFDEPSLRRQVRERQARVAEVVRRWRREVDGARSGW